MTRNEEIQSRKISRQQPKTRKPENLQLTKIWHLRSKLVTRGNTHSCHWAPKRIAGTITLNVRCVANNVNADEGIACVGCLLCEGLACKFTEGAVVESVVDLTSGGQTGLGRLGVFVATTLKPNPKQPTNSF